MNETLKAYCDQTNVVCTRCLPYRKSDQAFVEQKKWLDRAANGPLTAGLRVLRQPPSRLSFIARFGSSELLSAVVQADREQRAGARVRNTYSTPPGRAVADIRAAHQSLATLADVKPTTEHSIEPQSIERF
ncbi:hypothetical protein ABH999_000655 [Bradyrhizobium yuanmingense]